jgi:hypothetical protein
MPANKGYTSPRPFRGAALAPSCWLETFHVFRPRQQPKLRYVNMMVLVTESHFVLVAISLASTIYKKTFIAGSGVSCLPSYLAGGFCPKKCKDSGGGNNKDDMKWQK